MVTAHSLNAVHQHFLLSWGLSNGLRRPCHGILKEGFQVLFLLYFLLLDLWLMEILTAGLRTGIHGFNLFYILAGNVMMRFASRDRPAPSTGGNMSAPRTSPNRCCLFGARVIHYYYYHSWSIKTTNVANYTSKVIYLLLARIRHQMSYAQSLSVYPRMFSRQG